MNARRCDHRGSDEVIEQLVDLRRRATESAKRDGRIAGDEYFVAEQNARVVRDAETYYRGRFRGGAESFVIPLSSPAFAAALAGPRPERAFGVIYRSETERASHYSSARLPRQFHLVVHLDRTRALEPAMESA